MELFHNNKTNFCHDLVKDSNSHQWSINACQNDIITAGCHRITYEEMQNVAQQLGIAAQIKTIKHDIMHIAEQYLRNPENPNYLYVSYMGKRRRLFVNGKQGTVGIIAVGKQKKGYKFDDWNGIDKIFDKPPQVKDTAQINKRLVCKYQREASKAGFTNPFIRKIQNADYNKGLYENGITTGNHIDGQIVTLEAVRKWCSSQTYQKFCEAVKNRTPFHSFRFDFMGYDGTLWVEVFEKDDGYHCAGDLNAGFSKEFRNCGNGYYYLLVNEQTFIGYDVD